MKDRDKDSKDKLPELRRRAELAAEKSLGISDVSALAPEKVQELIHELRVHQIELEMQNVELRQTQLALEASRDKYEELYEFAPIGYFVLDQEGVILEANLTVSGILCIARAFLIGKPLASLVNKEDGDALYLHLRQALETPSKQTCDVRVTKEDGSQIQLRLDTLVCVTQDCSSTRLRTVVADITKRKHAEEDLYAFESRYQQLFESVRDGILMVDFDTGKILDVNQYLIDFLGYSHEEFLDKHLGDLSLLKDTVLNKAAFAKLLQKGHILHEELPLETSDGRNLDVEIVCNINVVCGVTFIQCNIRDITERKKAEEELRQSEEQYRAVFDNAGIGIDLLDRDGRIVKVNQALLNILGYAEEELSQRTFLDITHPDDREISKRNLEALMAGAIDSYRLEKRYVGKDGRIVWADLCSSAIRDANGENAGTVAVIEDISERKRAADTLRESEEQFRSLFENSLDAILLTMSDGRALRANPAAVQMFGLTEEEIRRVGREGVVDTTDPRLKPALEEMMRTGKFQGELNFKRKDGCVFPGELSSVLFKDAEDQWKSTMIVRDVTGRRRSEEAQKRLATAVEQAEEAITITDLAGTIQYINPAFEKMTGYSKDEALGNNPRILKSGKQDQEFYRNLWNTITQGKVWRGRFVNRRKDGAFYREEATISPVRDRSGGIVNFVAVKRDVTQELSLREQLFQAQKLEALGTLAGGIAHDFNNLLTVVMGFSELLLAEKEQDDPEYADLRKIFHAARNGAELVQGLLMFSRKSEPKPAPMDMNKQMVQVEKLLRRTIPKMIDIRLDLSSDLPNINADRSQIEQILMNLAINARDAMRDSGRLTVKTDTVTLDEGYCRLHLEANPGEYVLLEVTDTGHGMDKETVGHIFEPFFTTKEIGRGTGLGLAMVYGIVKQHNGHITVYSEVGLGTTFKVYLPAIPADVEPDVEASGIMPAFGTETVLLVDDEDLVSDLGARILTKHGYTVLKAANGREALDLFKKERSEISLVILDLIMPVMGGAECLKELLKIDPNVKVLIASGYSGNASVKDRIQLGAKGFVTKPFRVKELLRAVKRILDEG